MSGQNRPYKKACRQCGKMITMGIDQETLGWRPWEDYEEGIKHNCMKTGTSTTTTTQIQQQQNGAQILEEMITILKRIEDSQASLSWDVKQIKDHLNIETVNAANNQE